MSVNSDLWWMINDILNSFCIRHNIQIKKMLRCSLNLTLGCEKYPWADPHVDHNVPHYNMLMYFNTCSRGTTVIFKEQDDSGVGAIYTPGVVSTDYTIETEIAPVKGKIVVFDGRHFHANRFCIEPERRVVCVLTFIPENYE
jgi:hypothetical protein